MVSRSRSYDSRTQRFDVIGIDADDTLWDNEPLYQEAQSHLARLLQPFAPPDVVKERLLGTEVRNLELYGYGIKSFVLSLIETAIDLAGRRLGAEVVEEILNLGRTMMTSEVSLLPHVRETVKLLAHTYPLWLITKGDLLDQQRKLHRSGLAPYFVEIDVVSDKTVETYSELLTQRGVEPDHFAMVGNSPRSDVEPVVAVGGTAILIPYHVTWEHETMDAEAAQAHHILRHIGELPGLLAALAPPRRGLLHRLRMSRETL